MSRKKKLHKDSEQAIVGGVIAGLADYFGQDPLLFRLLAILLLLLTGLFPGVFLYIVAWFLVPKKPRFDYTVIE